MPRLMVGSAWRGSGGKHAVFNNRARHRAFREISDRVAFAHEGIKFRCSGLHFRIIHIVKVGQWQCFVFDVVFCKHGWLSIFLVIVHRSYNAMATIHENNARYYVPFCRGVRWSKMGVIGDDRQLTGSVDSDWYCGVMPMRLGPSLASTSAHSSLQPISAQTKLTYFSPFQSGGRHILVRHTSCRLFNNFDGGTLN